MQKRDINVLLTGAEGNSLIAVFIAPHIRVSDSGMEVRILHRGTMTSG